MRVLSALSLMSAAFAVEIPNLRLRQDKRPIAKRVNWFISDAKAQLLNTTKFLLEENREITQGVYFCCGGLSFDENGAPQLGDFDPEVISAFADAGIKTIMPTFGGDALPMKAWINRDAIGKQITDWVVKNKLTGVHNDWEAHGDSPGADSYHFYEFWGAVAVPLHAAGKTVGTCIETAPANVSHPWTPRTLSNDTIWHSYMFNWDYPYSLPYMDVITNMATYPMMHTTDGDNDWCVNFPNTTWCHSGCEDFVDHLTPAYKYIEQEECDPNRHTVSKWCGMKGHVQDMLDAGTNAASGQLSPGIWMNNCMKSEKFPDGVTAQGWTHDSLTSFLEYLDTVGVRSLDMWTSLLSQNDLDTCEWFTPELKLWVKGKGRYAV